MSSFLSDKKLWQSPDSNPTIRNRSQDWISISLRPRGVSKSSWRCMQYHTEATNTADRYSKTEMDCSEKTASACSTQLKAYFCIFNRPLSTSLSNKPFIISQYL